MIGQIYFKAMKFTAAMTACWTMVFSPLAIGQQTERLSKEVVAQSMKDMGLNKSITLEQFWKNIKTNTPAYSYKNFESLVKQNKNMKMPEMDFSTLRNTSGEEIPVVRFTQNGKTHTIQFYGEPNRWATFNGVVLTEREMQDVEKIYSKIAASDPNLRREANAYRARTSQATAKPQTKMARDFHRFNGFPRMTPQLWKSLTRQQRAEFIVALRSMWTDARRVTASQSKKTAANNSKKTASVSFEQLLEVVLGKEAFAQTDFSVEGGQTSRQGDQCVVGGYIGTYQIGDNVNGRNRLLCKLDVALNSERYTSGDLNYVTEANDVCRQQRGATFRACNPVVFGYDRSADNRGGPLCVDLMSREMQNATTFPGICDTRSRLTTENGANVVSVPTPGYGDRNEQRGQIEQEQRQGSEQEHYRLTKEYLDSVLGRAGRAGGPTSMDNILNGAWNADIDNELLGIQQQFEGEIERAIDICRVSSDNRVDRYQVEACQQLHRRWLFVERFIAKYRTDKACPAGTHYVGTYAAEELVTGNAKTAFNRRADTESNMCVCDNQESIKVGLGSAEASCNPIPPVIPEEPPAPPTCPPRPGVTLNADCKCENNNREPQGPDSEGQYKCEGSSLWPALAIAGLFGAFLFLGKKKKKNPPTTPPPPVLCPDGSPAPNGNLELCVQPPQLCTPPKTGTFPNCTCPNANSCPAGTTNNPNTCGCDPNPPEVCPGIFEGTPPNCACPVARVNACSGPFKLFDATTCECTDKPEPPTCPDGTKLLLGQSLTLCPKCPDGQTIIPAGGLSACPRTNEGGSGTSCPAGQTCNGGLPPPGTGN